jgi:transposase-like protein
MAALHAIANADTAREGTAPRDTFTRTYRRAHPNAVERLAHGWERMIAYCACPCEHWKHLPTTNFIESPFAAVRLRITAAKRFKKVENATALIWKTLLVVEQHFRKLNAPHRCTTVYHGATYRDGVLVIPSTRDLRAA